MNDRITEAFHSITFPRFQGFLRLPNNPVCTQIDAHRILIEIVVWVSSFSDSTYSSKMLLGWKYSLVLRYKREQDGVYRPTCAISMDFSSKWVIVKQLQWSNDKHVSYRFSASFNTTEYLASILEEAFIKKWIDVFVEPFPEWIEGVSYQSQAISRYQILGNLMKSIKKQHMMID